jgi:hypothetical protein
VLRERVSTLITRFSADNANSRAGSVSKLQSVQRSLCPNKVGRNRTGAPGSPQRTWAEKDGAQPQRSNLLNLRNQALDSKSIQPAVGAPAFMPPQARLRVTLIQIGRGSPRIYASAGTAESHTNPNWSWEPPHLCGGRSALALRERVSTLITRFRWDETAGPGA